MCYETPYPLVIQGDLEKSPHWDFPRRHIHVPRGHLEFFEAPTSPYPGPGPYFEFNRSN